MSEGLCRGFERAAIAGVLIGTFALAGCSGAASSPTAPTASVYARPRVEGVYAGTLTLTIPAANATIVCPASTVVTQADSAVNVAPIVLSGMCGDTSLPMGVLTIDQSGAFNAAALSQSYADATCGTYQTLGSGGFSEREMRLSFSVTSTTCRGYNFTTTMTRGGN